MPLEPVGVEFVSMGFDNFIRNIGEAAKAISEMGRMTENRLAALHELNDLMTTGGDAASKYAQSLISSSKNAASSTTDSANKIISNFTSMGTAAVTMGGQIKGVFSNIPKAFGKGFIAGNILGGLLGVLTPGGLGILSAPIIGTLTGLTTALYTAAGDVGKAIYTLFKNIAVSVATFLPKALSSIIKAGISIGDALVKFGKSIISIAKTILSPIINAVKGIFNTITGLFSATGTGGGWRSLGGTIFSSMFKFEVLKQVIRGIISEIKDFSAAAFDAAVELQTLTIRLDNLIASQVRAAGLAKDYNQSIPIASQYTQELLGWIQELALATPISVEDVSHVVSLSIAMGWSVKSAKTLTESILDYTAATGLGSEISERIIYNFAQMKQQGKVTGTELRDLGRGAFMPINTILDIMAENLGVAKDGLAAFREQASTGAVDVEEFFKAFETFVGRNMPEAARRMNYTFAAVRQNVADLFKTLLGWNVLGPLIKSVTKPFQDFVTSLQGKEVMEKANLIGKALAYVIDTARTFSDFITRPFKNLLAALGLVSPSIENVAKSIIKLGLLIMKVEMIIGRFITSLIPFAKKIGDEFGGTFENMGNDFFGWGMNLIVQFARGIVIGAAKALTAAINFVAKLLTSWFKVSSPPEILPDIGIWGMETINEWLHGFTQADFDILSDLEGVVKNALGALVDLGAISDVDASKMFSELSVGLIQAMDELNKTGKITTDIFDKLRNIGGVYGKEVAELLDLQIQHVIALERETQAQKDYDEAVKASAKSEVKAKGLISEYNKMLRKGADKNILKNKLKIVNAAEVELDANRKAEISKKTALDLAQEQLKVIEEQVKLQESLIKQLVDLAQAQKEATSGAGGAAEEVEEAINNMLEGLGELTAGEPLFDFDQIVKDAQEEFKLLFDGLEKDWGDTWFDSFVSPTSPFQIAVNNMATTFSGVLGKMRIAWDTFASAVNLPSWKEISNAWNAPTPDVGIKRGKDKRPAAERKTLLQRFQDVIDTFAKDVKENGGILNTLGSVAGYIFNSLVSKITEMFADEKNKQAIRDAFSGFMNWLADLILGKEQVDTKLDTVQPNTPGATRIGNALIEGIKTAAINYASKIDWGEVALSIVKWIYRAIISVAMYPLKLIGQSIIEGIGNATIEYAGDNAFLKAITDAWNTMIGVFKKVLGIKSPAETMLPIGKSIVEGMYTGIVSAVTDLWYMVSGGLDTFVKNIKTYFGLLSKIVTDNPLYNIGVSIVQGLINGIDSLMGSLSSKAEEIAKIVTSVTKSKLKGESPSKVFEQIGRDTIYGLAIGIEDASYLAERAMIKATKGLIASPMKSSMNASPVYGTTVNFGDVNINNGMDWSVFKAQVQRAVIEGR